MKTLVHRATRIAKKATCTKNSVIWKNGVLRANGYSSQEVREHYTLTRAHAAVLRRGTNTISLPYLKNVTDRISKILKQYKIKTMFTPTTQLRNMFRSAKDRRNPLSSARCFTEFPVPVVPSYIGTTQRSVNTRLTEHKRNCRFGYTERSAVAEHALSGKRT